MNKTILGLIITVLAIVGVAGVYAANRPSSDMAGTDMPDMSMAKEDNNPFTNPGADMSSDMVQMGKVSMDIKNFAFAQKTLKIKKGTTVTWTNQDSARHDITPDDESAAFMGSELLSKGESYSFTFDTVGSYKYICSPHPYMKAMVEVVE